MELLCRWPEQLAYEELRPLVLFGLPVPERARETGSSKRTLNRRIARFDAEGMDSLFASEGVRGRSLPPAMRRLVVDLKPEHPPMRPHEIARVCYVKFGRRPDYRTVERVLAEEPAPLRMVRRFPPYREMDDPRERRLAVVRLHAEGWSARNIASYLKTGYATWRRWRFYGEEVLAGREGALWLRERTLTIEHGGEPLSRHAVELAAGTGKPRAVGRSVLFGTAIPLPQPHLFRLEKLGERGWLKALRLEDYALRKARPEALQQVLFPYHEARGRFFVWGRS